MSHLGGTDQLQRLVEEGILREVIARLKSGKEAEVYLVQYVDEILAAKVYKDRSTRSFRNNAAYKEGRKTRNSRTQRAIEKGSSFGKSASEDSWKAREWEVLQTLHAAGVRVPKPTLFYEGILLMEAVIDGEGHPAQRLIEVDIPRERAAEIYADLRQQAIKMLTCDLIHGDLSPYNVLWAWNGPTIIDFPQAVGAAHNQQAEGFFTRDIQTLQRFFASIDPALHGASSDGAEIWQAYRRRELTPAFVPSGRARTEKKAHPPQPSHQQKLGSMRRAEAHPRAPSSSHSRRDTGDAGHRKSAGPVVSYVGQSHPPGKAPAPADKPHPPRRRRRHRR